MQTRTTLNYFWVIAFLLSFRADAAIISVPNTFSDGDILTAAELNQNFSTLADTINSLDNNNISSSAAIAPSKISAVIKGSSIARDASTGALSVKVDNSSIEISGDSLQVKADGITGTMLSSNVVDDFTLEQTGTTLNIKDDGVTTDKIADDAVTQAKLGAANIVESTAASAFFSTSTSYTDITNLSVSITTTGRPVVIVLQPSTSDSRISCSSSSNATPSWSCYFRVLRGSTNVGTNFVSYQYPDNASDTVVGLPGSVVHVVDTPSAGTYTYKVQWRGTGEDPQLFVNNYSLMVYEL